MSTVDTQKSKPLKAQGEKFSEDELSPGEKVVKVQRPLMATDCSAADKCMIYDEGRVHVTIQCSTEANEWAMGHKVKCFFVGKWMRTALQQNSIQLLNSPSNEFGYWKLLRIIEDETYMPEW